MRFDIKNIKSWANRHDVNTLSDVGIFLSYPVDLIKPVDNKLHIYLF